ncbi:MAG: helicase HerA-like C-terminal domain-containing protein [Pseudomonadota bacterium]
MSENDRIFVGGGGNDYAEAQSLLLKFANRHGLIAGATGTGKTVTLQILAESFSNAGVPVFLADVKGDLSGLAEAGSPTHKLHDKLISRAETIGFDDYDYEDFPVVFWDVFGKKGHPIRTTVTEMGPLLLARLMELNDTQEGILNIAFAVAEDEGLALLDLKDLRAMLVFLGENAKELSLEYGNVSKASIGAIQRRLLVLDNQGAEAFFGEPALELSDMIATTPDGRGRINLLAADELMHNPRLYATLLLWMLSELWEELPEIGDPDKPKFVFFFDEAHLLFEDAPKVLLEKVEQVARLIRSKGVGVYFISQNPADVPDDILGQLGNRVQHALRAFTPRDKKALRAAAQTFRQNPDLDTEEAISQVGVGEALVSCLEAKGIPAMVSRTLIRPPSSKLGPCTAEIRQKALKMSPVAGLYDEVLDRDSAYEKLKSRAEQRAATTDSPEPEEAPSRARRYGGGHSPMPKKQSSRRGDSPMDAMMKSAMRSAGTQIGRSVVKSLLRGLFR